MHRLWALQRPITEDDVSQALTDEASAPPRDAEDWHARLADWVHGTGDLPLQTLLAEFGVRGHIAAKDSFMAGASEFEINLAYMKAVGQGANEAPYGNIVAINRNAAILQLQCDNDAFAEGLFIHVGCLPC